MEYADVAWINCNAIGNHTFCKLGPNPHSLCLLRLTIPLTPMLEDGNSPCVSSMHPLNSSLHTIHLYSFIYLLHKYLLCFQWARPCARHVKKNNNNNSSHKNSKMMVLFVARLYVCGDIYYPITFVYIWKFSW